LIAYSFEGDANLDRRVDVTDLGFVATNWQHSGGTFRQGDFNYDRMIGVTDLGILATSWQKSLPGPAIPGFPGASGHGDKRGSHSQMLTDVLR
jgi:hypothetical protein